MWRWPAVRCAGACCSTCRGSPGCVPRRWWNTGRNLRRLGRRHRMVVPERMTEANEQEANEQEQKRPLTLRSGGTLGLRRPVETGQVRQSFSHGRSKAVTVEVRKKRVITPGAAPEPGRVESAPTVARAQPTAPAAAPATAEPTRRTAVVPR